MFSMETSVILHVSKEGRSRRDYFRMMVAIEEKYLAAILLYTLTEQMSKLENLQNASQNKVHKASKGSNLYILFHLKTNTCNFEQKYSFGTPVFQQFHDIFDRSVAQRSRRGHQFRCNVTFLTLTLVNISRERRSFACVVMW